MKISVQRIATSNRTRFPPKGSCLEKKSGSPYFRVGWWNSILARWGGSIKSQGFVPRFGIEGQGIGCNYWSQSSDEEGELHWSHCEELVWNPRFRAHLLSDLKGAWGSPEKCHIFVLALGLFLSSFHCGLWHKSRWHSCHLRKEQMRGVAMSASLLSKLIDLEMFQAMMIGQTLRHTKLRMRLKSRMFWTPMTSSMMALIQGHPCLAELRHEEGLLCSRGCWCHHGWGLVDWVGAVWHHWWEGRFPCASQWQNCQSRDWFASLCVTTSSWWFQICVCFFFAGKQMNLFWVAQMFGNKWLAKNEPFFFPHHSIDVYLDFVPRDSWQLHCLFLANPTWMSRDGS